MGPSQICGCPFREPRVFEIAHIIIYIYVYTPYMSDTVSQRVDKLPQIHTIYLELCMAKIFKRSPQSFSLSDEILSRVMRVVYHWPHTLCEFNVAVENCP